MATEEIASGVYANVDYEGSNIAVITTDMGLVLVDTPMLPQDVKEWQEFVLDLDSNGPKYIIVTHHHFDHIIGNKILGGQVIMNELARDEMNVVGGTLREQMAGAMPDRTEEEVNFILTQPLVQPRFTFNDELSLFMGNKTLRLIHTGGHTGGSISVYLEEDGIILPGDNITAGQHPFKGQANFKEWMEALKWMQQLDINKIIPGHGLVCEKDEIAKLLECLTRMWFMTMDLIRTGIGRDKVIQEVHNRLISYYDIEPARLQGAKMMFDLGTSRLYEEILAQI